MASRQNDDDGRKQLLTNRRSVLKLVGAAGLAAVTAGAATAAPEGSFDSTVNLGNQGLAAGDTIDSYLDEHLTSGTQVVVPAGEYNWDGGGIGGEYENAALVGDGDVVFNRPEPSVQVRPSITATGGVVTVQNITVRGQAGYEQSRIRVQANSGARLVFDNVNMPDGTVPDSSDSMGFYGGDGHAGELVFQNCYFSNFGNLALYLDSMGDSDGGDGPIEVTNCVFENNNAAAVKFGSSNSHVHDSLVVNDQTAPGDYGGGVEQRGLKIDVPGTGIVVENMHFYHTDVAAEPIELDDDGSGGGGEIRNCRIHNGSSAPAIEEKWDASGSWSGSGLHVTGPGDLTVPSYFTDICTGDGCEVPTTDHGAFLDAGSSSGGSNTSSTTSGDNSTSTSTGNSTSTSTEMTTSDGGSDDDSAEDSSSEDQSSEEEQSEDSSSEEEQSEDSSNEEAASETRNISGSSAPATTTSEDSGQPEGTPVEVIAAEGGPKFQYEFSVDGDASKVTTAGNLASEGNDSVSASDDGAVVNGEVGNGYGDTYRVTGDLSAFSASTDAENVTVNVGDEDVTSDLVDSGESGDSEDGGADEESEGNDGEEKGGDGKSSDSEDEQSGDASSKDKHSGKADSKDECAFDREA